MLNLAITFYFLAKISFYNKTGFLIIKQLYLLNILLVLNYYDILMKYKHSNKLYNIL